MIVLDFFFVFVAVLPESGGSKSVSTPSGLNIGSKYGFLCIKHELYIQPADMTLLKLCILFSNVSHFCVVFWLMLWYSCLLVSVFWITTFSSLVDDDLLLIAVLRITFIYLIYANVCQIFYKTIASVYKT